MSTAVAAEGDEGIKETPSPSSFLIKEDDSSRGKAQTDDAQEDTDVDRKDLTEPDRDKELMDDADADSNTPEPSPSSSSCSITLSESLTFDTDVRQVFVKDCKQFVNAFAAAVEQRVSSGGVANAGHTVRQDLKRGEQGMDRQADLEIALDNAGLWLPLTRGIESFEAEKNPVGSSTPGSSLVSPSEVFPLTRVDPEQSLLAGFKSFEAPAAVVEQSEFRMG